MALSSTLNTTEPLRRDETRKRADKERKKRKDTVVLNELKKIEVGNK